MLSKLMETSTMRPRKAKTSQSSHSDTEVDRRSQNTSFSLARQNQNNKNIRFLFYWMALALCVGMMFGYVNIVHRVTNSNSRDLRSQDNVAPRNQSKTLRVKPSNEKPKNTIASSAISGDNQNGQNTIGKDISLIDQFKDQIAKEKNARGERVAKKKAQADEKTTLVDMKHIVDYKSVELGASLIERGVQDFEHQEGVAIVTKIHGEHQWVNLEQTFCLLHSAYNHRVLYDIVVFTSEPVQNTTLLETLRSIVAPAKITLVIDNRGFENEVKDLSPQRLEAFMGRCNVTSPQNLSWWSNCPVRAAYNWQAEFRAKHIWTHQALQDYQYMMWMDADAFCTKVWTVDPVAFFIRNDLVALFDNWPKGRNMGEETQNRIVKSFNKTLCSIQLVNGSFQSDVGGNCTVARVPLIHGFFHITNLTFYRQPVVQRFVNNWIGDCFMCREWDDQAAMTIPAAMLAPEKTWDMRSHNLTMNVFHNLDNDGKMNERLKPLGFTNLWREKGQAMFPEAYGKCTIRAKW